MKKVGLAFLLLVAVFLLFWGGSLLRCNILTALYGKNFVGLEQQTNMLPPADYLKILKYSDDYAEVYYVIKDSTGNVFTFKRQDNKWQMAKWKTTVWSKYGNVDEILWPYLYHSAEGQSLIILASAIVTIVFGVAALIAHRRQNAKKQMLYRNS